jgi:sec-independent protein translocase protein TatA
MKLGIWELLIILVIVMLLFGTKKLKGIGADLGSAIKGFRSSLGDADAEGKVEAPSDKGRVIEGGTVNSDDKQKV